MNGNEIINTIICAILIGSCLGVLLRVLRIKYKK